MPSHVFSGVNAWVGVRDLSDEGSLISEYPCFCKLSGVEEIVN